MMFCSLFWFNFEADFVDNWSDVGIFILILLICFTEFLTLVDVDSFLSVRDDLFSVQCEIMLE